MPRLIFVLAIVCAPAVASAQSVTLQGWTDDGKAVVEIQDPVAAWQSEWMSGAENTGDFWGVCTVAAPKDAAQDGDGACTLCADAASCGLTAPITATASMKSPDKKIKVKDKRKCRKDPEASFGGKTCTRTLSFGKKGALSFDETWFGDKADAHVYFRPDSQAALVALDVHGRMDGVDWASMYVVDLSSKTSYDFALTGKKTHPSEGADNTGGSGKVVLAVTTDGKTRKVTIEKLSLYSEDSLFGLGEPITFGADLVPAMMANGAPDTDDFSTDLAAAVKAHLPEGTVQAAGFVDDGDHHSYSFVVYALVKDAAGVHVVKQSWASDGTEPSDSATLSLKL